MGIVDMKDVVGIWVDDPMGSAKLIKCEECATNEEWDNALEDDLITSSDIENQEQACFCDECKKRL